VLPTAPVGVIKAVWLWGHRLAVVVGVRHAVFAAGSQRVEVDECGGPACLQSRLWGADVARLRGSGAAGEQADQALDPRSGAAPMLGSGGVVERLAGRDDEGFLALES
jgi:hypothetical protein